MAGHHDGITCITSWKNLLVSGSLDKTVKIWNIFDLQTRIREKA